MSHNYYSLHDFVDQPNLIDKSSISTKNIWHSMRELLDLKFKIHTFVWT